MDALFVELYFMYHLTNFLVVLILSYIFFQIDNVSEPFPETSQQVVSTTNTDGRRKKTKSSSFVTVCAVIKLSTYSRSD